MTMGALSGTANKEKERAKFNIAPCEAEDEYLKNNKRKLELKGYTRSRLRGGFFYTHFPY